MHRALGLFAFILLAASPAARAASPADLPIEDFFRRFDFSRVLLSPDGTKVAALARQGERINLFVIDVATKQPRRITDLGDKDVGWFEWISHERLVFTVMEDNQLAGGLFAVNSDGKRFKVLAESLEQQGGRGARIYRHTEFLSRVPGDDHDILVLNNDRLELDYDVYRLDTLSGRKRMVARNPGGVQLWVADHAGAVRAAFGERGLERFVLHRETADGEWREVRRADIFDGEIIPLEFSADNRTLFVSSTVGRDTAAVHRFDPRTGELGEEVFADPVYDVEGVTLAENGDGLLGVALEREKPAVVWLDPKMAELQQMIDEALPGTLNRIVSRTKDGRWVVIWATSDRDPGTFYLLETRELAMEKLVTRAPWLDPRLMSPMQPIQYTSRDGLTIHGYLTLPVGGEGRPHPLIVNPHGGPWVRDTWGFNREVQFLASRGYAILQMNFRGSTGYGRKHLQAGYNQWGLKMQDDITDGVRWAIEQGHADPERVAIYGGSYGGYATMAGLTFTPELYRCGINYVGVTDISLLLRSIPDWWEPARERLEAMTGHGRRDRERLEATSPLRNVDKIQVPLLLAYGELDPRVILKHAHQLVDELKRHDKPYELIIKRDEGHGFVRLRNQLDYYGRVEQFLEKHLRHAPPRGRVDVQPTQVLEMPARAN